MSLGLGAYLRAVHDGHCTGDEFWPSDAPTKEPVTPIAAISTRLGRTCHALSWAQTFFEDSADADDVADCDGNARVARPGSTQRGDRFRIQAIHG